MDSKLIRQEITEISDTSKRGINTDYFKSLLLKVKVTMKNFAMGLFPNHCKSWKPESTLAMKFDELPEIVQVKIEMLDSRDRKEKMCCAELKYLN